VAQPTDAPLAALEEALDGAALLGLELDTRYRVLAVTLELPDGHDPWGSGVPSDAAGEVDRRIQLLVSPVSTVLGSFRREPAGGGRGEVYTFGDDQLVDVAAAFAGAVPGAPRFGRPEPRPGSWAPTWSLEGRSTAGDGIARTLTVSVRTDDHDGELALDVFVRFDEALVRDAAGRDLERLEAPGTSPLG
jgi:hypothetical protein